MDSTQHIWLGLYHKALEERSCCNHGCSVCKTVRIRAGAEQAGVPKDSLRNVYDLHRILVRMDIDRSIKEEEEENLRQKANLETPQTKSSPTAHT